MYYWGYGFVNRGFLQGPYLPIYGFGALGFGLLAVVIIDLILTLITKNDKIIINILRLIDVNVK